MKNELETLSKKERVFLIKLLEAHQDDIIWATAREKRMIELILTILKKRG